MDYPHDMNYPHAVSKLTDKFDDGFVVGYSEVSRGEPVDPELPYYFHEFQRGYVTGRKMYAALHAGADYATKHTTPADEPHTIDS